MTGSSATGRSSAGRPPTRSARSLGRPCRVLHSPLSCAATATERRAPIVIGIAARERDTHAQHRGPTQESAGKHDPKPNASIPICIRDSSDAVLTSRVPAIRACSRNSFRRGAHRVRPDPGAAAHDVRAPRLTTSSENADRFARSAPQPRFEGAARVPAEVNSSEFGEGPPNAGTPSDAPFRAFRCVRRWKSGSRILVNRSSPPWSSR